MKIIFTGAQGTGKTTILNHYKEQGYNTITEVVRKLSEEGVKINEMGDLKGQQKIFNEYNKLLNKEESYISDRGLTDVAAYTVYLGRKNDDMKLLIETIYQLVDISVFYKSNPDIITCYFPIEFPITADGVRSMDEEFRTEIDKNIKNSLEGLGIQYHTITGTVEERIKQIDKIIQDVTL